MSINVTIIIIIITIYFLINFLNSQYSICYFITLYMYT